MLTFLLFVFLVGSGFNWALDGKFRTLKLFLFFLFLLLETFLTFLSFFFFVDSPGFDLGLWKVETVSFFEKLTFFLFFFYFIRLLTLLYVFFFRFWSRIMETLKYRKFRICDHSVNFLV